MEVDGEGVGISPPGRCVYAQNDAYLELCNPGWSTQWHAGFGNAFVLLALFVIWVWYGIAVHPLLFGKLIFFWRVASNYDSGDLLFGWLLLFPLALGSAYLIYIWFILGGWRTAWFSPLRGRIRFNRLTRKVYVLRPDSCGGNAVFEWDRLVALLHRTPPGHRLEGRIDSCLVLYHPPFDAYDPQAKEEDAIFVGPSLLPKATYATAALWEYIRRYMQEGPTVDVIPPNAPEDFAQVPRYLPQDYFTYCGKPSGLQLGLELQLSFFDKLMHLMSQATCSWPKFPKEWQSDSGLGEPEDKPVQTGAVMTALVYRAEDKLSPEDEVELMTHYGSEEALAEAKAKLARMRAGQS